MEKNERMYLVSFGDSRKYKVVAENGRYDRINEVRDEVEAFLKEKFPADGALKFYREPHVQDVPSEDMEKYIDYPELNEAAVKEIEETLITEVGNFNDQSQLDSNAPFNAVAPEY